MTRAGVLDFLGVVRAVAYALAITLALLAVAMYVCGQWWPVLRFMYASLAPFLLTGLILAWTAGIARVLVRRMRFATPQDGAR